MRFAHRHWCRLYPELRYAGQHRNQRPHACRVVLERDGTSARNDGQYTAAPAQTTREIFTVSVPRPAPIVRSAPCAAARWFQHWSLLHQQYRRIDRFAGDRLHRRRVEAGNRISHRPTKFRVQHECHEPHHWNLTGVAALNFVTAGHHCPGCSQERQRRRRPDSSQFLDYN